MSKKLLILRHAKSDWNARHKYDYERPLSQRGDNDARLIGQWLAREKLEPDYIICSPAKRARETLLNISGYFGVTNIPTEYPESVYLASLGTLKTSIGSVPGTARCLLLVGHNPGLEELVVYLSKQPMPRSRNGKLFTTANLAVFELEQDFNQLDSRSAVLKKLVRPVELRG